MFNFLMDADNYDSRCVGRYEEEEIIISTARCSDGRKPYETGIAHPDYNGGSFVIVEAYDTKEDANNAHSK